MLTQAELKSIFNYNPETGVFIRIKSKSPRIKLNTIAGGLNGKGYICIRFNGKKYLAHRLAWVYVYGYVPAQEVDHINGVKTDNRISNLREADRFSNMQNQIKAAKSNKTTGLLGCHLHKRSGKYYASIRIDGKTKHIGCFDKAIDAHKAYIEAKRIFHNGCTI